jgi:TPR repeat protein
MKYISLLLTTLLATSAFASEKECDINWLETKAEQNHAPSVERLAEIYIEGDCGVHISDAKADEWNQRLASLRPEYAFRYAWKIENGFILADNPLSKAEKWYRKAAEQGHAKAQLVLADHYFQGKFKKDYVMSYVWARMALPSKEHWNYHESLKGGDAPYILGALAKVMNKSEVDKAQKLAAKCSDSDYKDCYPWFSW